MASIPSNYEINVAKKRNKDDEYGIHYCRIELSDTFRENAEEKLKFIREKFGDEFNVTMTYWECCGHKIEV
ncbi:MAG: hypothetical protein K6F00_11115 [Lachnospiraceae bacterium]|nr:hypothetical protein [Lachnospiraceae bacterium]